MRRLGSIAAQMILNPGAHMLFQFEELGADESEKTATGNNVDPKKVVWNYLNDANRKGLSDNYSQLNWFRRANPDLFSQSATFNNYCDVNSWDGGRTIYASNGNKEMILVVNPLVPTTQKVFTVNFKSSSINDYQIISYSSGINKPSVAPSSGKVSLPGNSYVLIANKNCAGIEEIEADNSKENVTVIGENGKITILGEYKKAEVYSLSGQRLSMNVPAGIYIVVVDGKATKVLVR